MPYMNEITEGFAEDAQARSEGDSGQGPFVPFVPFVPGVPFRADAPGEDARYSPEGDSGSAAPEGDSGSAAFVPFVPFVPGDASRLPPFPADSLPGPLRKMALAAAENLQVAVDMTAVAGLAVLSLCVQGKFVINPKPGWVEPLNLYAAVIARPSDRKSPALAVMTRPLHAFEQQENERRAPLVDQYHARKSILEKRLANLKEQAAKPVRPDAKGPHICMGDIAQVQDELRELEQEAVHPLRLLADDTTPEALVSLMTANDGRMGIMSDEGGIFDIIAGRYSNGKMNMDVFLKAYTGNPLRIDRVGRPAESIAHPALTMLLMVQPVVLEEIMGNQDFAGRGFLARPLYSLPVSTVGRRAYDTPPVPQEVEAGYRIIIETLLSVPETGEARVIHVSPEAHQEAKRFAESLEPRLLDDLGDLDDLEGWAGKYHGQVMRIAGVLHCCLHGENAAERPVSLHTMQQAQIIGGYFLEHAKAAFQIMGLSDSKEVKDAKYILKRIHAGGLYETTKRELFRQCDGRMRSMEELEPGLKVLVDRGYIRIEKVRTGGRPTEKIIFNPEAKGQKGQKGQKVGGV